MADDRPELTYALGIDLGASNARVGLVCSDGRILELRSQATAAGGLYSGAALADQLAALVAQVRVSHAAQGLPLAGIGVGMAGQIDRQGNVVGTCRPRESGWETLPFRALLAARLGAELPIHIENDTKAAAWGEYLYGAGRGSRSMICLTVGTGVGGGLVLDGELYHGRAGLAGHLGLMSVDMRGPRSLCGMVGCLEDYASGTGIATAAQHALRGGRHSTMLELAQGRIDGVTSEMVFAAARSGDALANETIGSAAYALGVAIAGLLHVLNPDVVVIGGGVAEQGEVFLRPVRRAVAELSMPSFADTPVVSAQLGNLAGVIGAAALCWSAAPEPRP